MRKYEVELQIMKTRIYQIEAENDADLIAKNHRKELIDKGELVETIKAEVVMKNWRQMKNE